MSTIPQSLTTAVAHHQAGRLREAEEIYRKILAANPQEPDALHLMGLISHQAGRHDAAVEQIRRAVGLRPDAARFHNSLAVVYTSLGQLADAVDSYRAALQAQPDYADAHCNLGIALLDQGKSDEAIAALRRAIQLKPDHLKAHNNLGNALAAVGNPDQAEAAYRQALEIDPEYPETHFNLGNLLQDGGKLDQAIAAYRSAIQFKPDYLKALNNLGNALGDQDQLEAAVEVYQGAAQIDPSFGQAHFNLANVYRRQGLVERAADSYRRLVRLEPEESLWRLQAAALCPAVFESTEEAHRYRRNLSDELARLGGRQSRPTISGSAIYGSEPPFNLQFDSANLRPIKEAYARVFDGCFDNRFDDETPKKPRNGGRPKIGVVVTAGNERLFLKSMRGVLERIDPGLFEITVVCHSGGFDLPGNAPAENKVGLLEISQRLDRAAEVVRRAKFDLLYYWEVGNDTVNYFLPFFRLAPVQCTSWGIQVTSGIGRIDAYLSSRLVEPDDAQDHYSERLLLADTLLTYQYPVSLPGSPKRREDFGFRANQDLYLCAQHLGKFHPDFDLVLREILRRDDRGLVVVTADRYGHNALRLKTRFAATLPEVADRIVFLPWQANPDYLALTAAADVLLDPPYFGGVNSTYDGLALGKPIVTRPSAFHRGRYTFGCYAKMGYTECVASSEEDYVRIAVSLGTDREYRTQVETQIRTRSPLLFEDLEAVREHERLWGQLVEESRLG